MQEKSISDRISYLPASDRPLSADVVVIRGNSYNWIYDVGSSEEAMNFINALSGENKIVISHFHRDHTENLNRVRYDCLYCGDFTRKKIQRGIEVSEKISIDDGVRLEIVPLPSTHSKGAVCLQVNNKIAFLGDAVYSERKKGRRVYNTNLLKDMISCLEDLCVESFALSHDEHFIQPKEKVLNDLKEIYAKRNPNEPYVYLA